MLKECSRITADDETHTYREGERETGSTLQWNSKHYHRDRRTDEDEAQMRKGKRERGIERESQCGVCVCMCVAVSEDPIG